MKKIPPFIFLLLLSCAGAPRVRQTYISISEMTDESRLRVLQENFSGSYSSTHHDHPNGRVIIQKEPIDGIVEPTIILKDGKNVTDKIPLSTIVAVRGVEVENDGNYAKSVGIWYNGDSSTHQGQKYNFFLLGVREEPKFIAEVLSHYRNHRRKVQQCPTCPQQPPEPELHELGMVYFEDCETDPYKSTSQGMKELETIIEKYLAESKNPAKLIIEGNADSRSAVHCKNDNLTLAGLRAVEVAKALQRRFDSAFSIKTTINYQGSGDNERSVEVYLK